jgi:hypothetical protein
MKNLKFKIKNGLRAAVLLPFAFCIFNCSAVYRQPFLYYGIDQFGFPVTNAVTIEAWPPTNAITANNTNLVISVAHTFVPDANGFFSNNIAVGNYRLQVAGFTPGAPFSILSNAAPVIISQTANVPVTTFLNFTLAQFSDAGTMAYRSTNDFALVANIGSIARRGSNDFALATTVGPMAIRSTNDFALATTVGPMAIRDTNDFFLAASAGSIATRGSNDFHLADGNIGATNLTVGVANFATNGFQVWIAYKTNGDPGNAFTNAPQGSFLTTTNGYFGRLSNAVWHAIAL